MVRADVFRPPSALPTALLSVVQYGVLVHTCGDRVQYNRIFQSWLLVPRWFDIGFARLRYHYVKIA